MWVMSDRKKRKAGYTMLEILIVVGILTVIVTMAIPNITRMKKHAYESAAIEGLRAIADAEELYYDVGGYYTGGGNQIADLRKVDTVFVTRSSGCGSSRSALAWPHQQTSYRHVLHYCPVKAQSVPLKGHVGLESPRNLARLRRRGHRRRQ